MTLIGHNSGVAAALASAYAAFLDRRDELLESMARVPSTIEDDEQQKKVSDLAIMIADQLTKCEAARQAEKAPFLENGRLVDGFFTAGINDPLSAAHKRLLAIGGEYLRAKRAQEERRLLEEVRAAESRAAAALEAASTMSASGHSEIASKLLDMAVSAESSANQQRAEIGSASAADLSRIRSDSGALATLSERVFCIAFERSSVDLEALRAHFSDASIAKAVKGWIRVNLIAVKSGKLQLHGATIKKEAHAQYRR